MTTRIRHRRASPTRTAGSTVPLKPNCLNSSTTTPVPRPKSTTTSRQITRVCSEKYSKSSIRTYEFPRRWMFHWNPFKIGKPAVGFGIERTLHHTWRFTFELALVSNELKRKNCQDNCIVPIILMRIDASPSNRDFDEYQMVDIESATLFSDFQTQRRPAKMINVQLFRVFLFSFFNLFIFQN